MLEAKLSLAALDTDKSSLSANPAGLLTHGGTGTTCRLVGAFMACWNQSCHWQLWIRISGSLYGAINTNKAENGNPRFLPLCFFCRSGGKPISGLHLWYNSNIGFLQLVGTDRQKNGAYACSRATGATTGLASIRYRAAMG